MKKKIAVIVGTRPEAIKMAPVIHRLQASPVFDCIVVATAQHRQMLDQVLRIFGIVPDHDLDIMQPDQTLAGLTARLLAGLDRVFRDVQPDAVLVQGDTTSVMAASLAAAYLNIPVGHVEAGLRTGDMRNPFPEELNRVMTARMARWHFAPTTTARDHLLREGVPPSAVEVTGNTVIDALLQARRHPDKPAAASVPGRRTILVTTHRRENFGEPLQQVCTALLRLLDSHPDVDIVFPVHPNPNVVQVVQARLAGHPRIRLCAPLEYLDFVAAMENAHLILSDSGGVQEEAPALARPVLVLREETERPEAVQAGVVELVGTDADRIVARAQRLLDDPQAYRGMAQGSSPYGDGHAAARIERVLLQAFAPADAAEAALPIPALVA